MIVNYLLQETSFFFRFSYNTFIEVFLQLKRRKNVKIVDYECIRRKK